MVTFALSPAVEASSTSLDVRVDHVVEIRNGGLLVINDTVTLSNTGGSPELLHNYMLGFPYAHRSNLDYAFAYEASNPHSRLKLELNAGMGRTGFYGVNVVYPQAVNISGGGQYKFTVVYVFSNSITPREAAGETTYNASFPAYPSLTQSAYEANLTIIFPDGLYYVESSFGKNGVNFTRNIIGSKNYFYNVTSNLSEFSDQTGWFVIAKSTSALELLEVNEVKREIEFPSMEQIVVSDSYRVLNKADNLTQLKIKIPKGASDVSAFDDFGLISTANLRIEKGGTGTDVTITLPIPQGKGVEERIMVHYKLPLKDYAKIESWSEFNVSMALFENFNWTIRRLATTITLPEGAALLSSPLSPGLNNIQNNAFSSSLTFVFQNATPFHDLSFNFKYGRVVFWESFRPTLWMSALVMVIAAIVGVWRVYQPPAAPITTAIAPVRVEELRNFVDSYGDKRRYQRELESLETQARKGKIPRRTYKVRRMTIESRLASLSRDLGALREKIRRAGPRYTDLMRQLEVAETELEGVEADISRTEVRYRRGDISPAAYHKLLEDSFRRRDRAKTTVEGVLLRLKEEIS